MNTTLANKIKIMQAAQAGQTIEEFCPLLKKWVTTANPAWEWSIYGYRVKTLPVMIRHYRCGDFVYVVTTGFSPDEDQATKQTVENPDVEWLDDWHEAKFPSSENND